MHNVHIIEPKFTCRQLSVEYFTRQVTDLTALSRCGEGADADSHLAAMEAHAASLDAQCAYRAFAPGEAATIHSMLWTGIMLCLAP